MRCRVKIKKRKVTTKQVSLKPHSIQLFIEITLKTLEQHWNMDETKEMDERSYDLLSGPYYKMPQAPGP